MQSNAKHSRVKENREKQKRKIHHILSLPFALHRFALLYPSSCFMFFNFEHTESTQHSQPRSQAVLSLTLSEIVAENI